MRDVEIINTELIIADIEQIERSLPGLEKKSRTKDPEAAKLYPILKRMFDVLMAGQLAYSVADDLTEEELLLIKPYNFLTFKPFIYAINIGTEDFANSATIAKEFSEKLHRPVVLVCAKLESEML
ncbi:MAG: hypothetical protein WCJ81_02990 [bacterium]